MKFGAATESALVTLAVVVAVGVGLSVWSVIPSGSTAAPAGAQYAGSAPGSVAGGSGAAGASGPRGGGGTGSAGSVGGAVAGAGGLGGTAGGGAAGTGAAGPLSQPAGLACAAGRNGGATDVGVSAGAIKLASTVVDDGPGASFLGPVPIAMTAVANQVNRSGGICGRQLNLELRNDSWQATLGCQYIQNFVESDHVFALAVVPSSEGLRTCDSFIRQAGVPVVGTDGMLSDQYTNPWIWPVATSTISTMHIMANWAWSQGMRNFGIVFDSGYHFGVEGAYAFDQAYKRLSGHDIPGYDPSLSNCSARFCGITNNQSSYAGQHQQFDTACFNSVGTGPACDFIAYLLEPDLALQWLALGSSQSVVIAGAQPLFDRDAFAAQCGNPCQRMVVWSGYQPPLGSYAGLPAENAYVSTVQAQSASADVDSQFLEGGYVGMRLLVTALQKVGPDLTRARLAATLNSMKFNSGLTAAPLRWTAGDHYANASASGWNIVYQGGQFGGFRQVTPFLPDPWVGQDAQRGG
ncbi:MAG: ABC transporter substrate-binding protein [Mycobacteriales bacterium]